MTDKRSKYDTDPLDPDFVRRAEEASGLTGGASASDPTAPFRQPLHTEEQTRRFDEQPSDSYPSVFVPPAYQPPRPPQQRPFTTFGTGPHQPPPSPIAPPPPPGPSSPYQPPSQPPFQPGTQPPSRTVARLGLPEHIANALPYAPFYIGLVAALIELAVVPRTETRTRFHAAQGLALQLAVILGTLLFRFVGVITGSRAGGALFLLASFVFLVVSFIRVWQGKPHHIAPLDEATRRIGERIAPSSRQ